MVYALSELWSALRACGIIVASEERRIAEKVIEDATYPTFATQHTRNTNVGISWILSVGRRQFGELFRRPAFIPRDFAGPRKCMGYV